MRTVGMVVGLAALAVPVWSQDMYRWTDRAGTVHYANSPPADAHVTRIPSVVPRFTEERAAEPADGGADAPEGGARASAPAGDPDAFSADASLRRNAFERDLRATERRLRELDSRLAVLVRARNQNAGGSAATGGVGATAFDLRSEEERALADERERVAQHGAEVRNDAAQLRQEVAARFGGTPPPWWIDVR